MRQGNYTNDSGLERNLSAAAPFKRPEVYIPTEEYPQ